MSLHNKKILKKIDLILLVLFPLLAALISLIIKANFLVSTLLFFGLPALWLSYRTPQMIKRTALFSLIFSLPFTILIDYIAILDKSWFVPLTVFPFRLLGVIPLEDFIWGFLLIYAVIIFYEYFLDKGKHNLIDQRMKYLILPLVVLLITFFVLVFTKPEFLMLKYAYLWLGVALIFLPAVTFLSFFPKLLSKYVKTGIYFFILAFLFELTGLQLGQWEFPGTHFIGWVEMFGFHFPFEEFFFWMILAATAILSYYEFFDDDRK